MEPSRAGQTPALAYLLGRHAWTILNLGTRKVPDRRAAWQGSASLLWLEAIPCVVLSCKGTSLEQTQDKSRTDPYMTGLVAKLVLECL